MNVALLNQKGGIGKTTLALHLAGQWARQGKRIRRTDADPQRSALDWTEQGVRCRYAHLFGVIALLHERLHRKALELPRRSDHILVDGPPRVAALLHSALLASDLALIPARPSPSDGWTSIEMLVLIAEARVLRPRLGARFVLNRCPARTAIARETARSLAERDRPTLAAWIGRRALFAEAAQTDQLVFERDDDSLREIATSTSELERLAP
jgi:chromosome partitioning protein